MSLRPKISHSVGYRLWATMAAAATVLCSPAAPPTCATRTLEKSAFAGTTVQGVPALGIPRTAYSPLKVQAGGGKKIKVANPWGPAGGANFRDGVDASGRQAKGKGVYQFTNKYGANVDGYSPIYSPEEWPSSGDVYVGGTTGLLIWAITLGAILLGGALLIYNTSALSQ